MPEWLWPAPYSDDRDRIPNDETLYRRVPRGWLKNRDDVGVWVLDSQSFQDLPLEDANEKGYELRCMSVGVGRILEQHGGPLRMLEDKQTFADLGIAQFTAECIRAGNQGIMYAPEEGRPWHAVVFALDAEKRSKGMHRSAMRCATWWRQPD